jgi:hypothetical protein
MHTHKKLLPREHLFVEGGLSKYYQSDFIWAGHRTKKGATQPFALRCPPCSSPLLSLLLQNNRLLADWIHLLPFVVCLAYFRPGLDRPKVEGPLHLRRTDRTFLSSQASQPHDFEIHLGVIFLYCYQYCDAVISDRVNGRSLTYPGTGVPSFSRFVLV